MKAIILPSGDPEKLAPLTTAIPEYVLPVANKPLVEHLIELLVRNHITEIILVVKHMPYETEQYFGKGERWGVNISYSLEKEYPGIAPCLGRIKSRLDDDFLVLPANMAMDARLLDLINAHKAGMGEMTLLQNQHDQKDETLAAASDGSKMEDPFDPFIMTPKALFSILSHSSIRNMGQIVAALVQKDLTVLPHRLSYNRRTICSLDDYLKLNREMISNRFEGAILPGKQIADGIWIGNHTKIHPGARISPPALIGSNCNLLKGCVIEKNTVIGDNVIVNKDALVDGSVVLNSTYVGDQTDIKNSVVRKNLMIDVARSTHVFLEDEFILGDLNKKSLSGKGQRFFNLLFAVLLLVIFSPIMALCYLYHLILPSKGFFSSKQRFGSYEVVDFQGTIRPRPFNLYRFRCKNRLLQKLPGLFNVIKGNMSLVGLSPLSGNEVSTLEEDWETLRFNIPVGLFHLWEVEGGKDITTEEKLVAESYYAMTRTFWSDVKILMKSLLPN